MSANQEVEQSMNSNPRTAIGMISPLHYVFVVSDGRTSESAGLSLAQLAAVMVSCVLRGIFEIAGTSSVYQALLMWFGIAMSVVGAVAHGIFMIKNA